MEIKGDDGRTEVAYLDSNVKQNGEMIMKLRDKILYMSFGAMLVVLGMVLNSLVSGDADAQVGGGGCRIDIKCGPFFSRPLA